MATSEPHAEVRPLASVFERLLVCSGVAFSRYHCCGWPPRTHVEQARHPEIVLPMSGAYVRHDASGSVYLDRSTVGFFEAGSPYTIEHCRQRPDVTTILAIIDEKAFRDAGGLVRPGHRFFPRSAVRAIARLQMAHRRFLLEVSTVSDPLALEESAITLASEACSLVQESSAELARTASWRRDIAVGIADYLNENWQRSPTLSDVAAYVGYSVFYVCRLFHDEMGSSIHSYMLALRLESALSLLLETDRSLTDVALELGFASHSHFTATFTKWAGMSPSAARRRAGAGSCARI